jgi:hypothetical protein
LHELASQVATSDAFFARATPAIARSGFYVFGHIIFQDAIKA